MLFEKDWSNANNIQQHLNREEYYIQKSLNTALNYGKIATKEYAKCLADQIKYKVIGLSSAGLVCSLGISADMLFSSSTKYYFSQLCEININAYSALSIGIISCLNIPQENLMSSFIQLSVCLTGPLVEEIIFRGIIQECMLRRLPKKVLEKIAPDYAWVVDSMPAKLLRIGCSSALFGLSHIDQWDKNGGVVSQIISGINHGISVENSNGNLLKTVACHVINNCAAFIFSYKTGNLAAVGLASS